MIRIRRKKLATAALTLLTGSVVVLGYTGWLDGFSNRVQSNQPGLHKVTKVVDGDTIEVDMEGRSELIRLIGVDTPETHDPRKPVQCFGHAATDFTKKLIGNHPVRLEADPLNTNRDRYSRLLRFVYLPNGTLVNIEIIRQGYGFAYTSFPFAKLEEFRQAEKEARQQGRGLWSSCTLTPNEYGGFTPNAAL